MHIIKDDQPRPRGRPFKSKEQRDEIKIHIAKTAQSLFQKEGYATVSMRRLAKEAGCSPMTLYKYYDGKIAVLQTLWQVVFKDVFEQLHKALISVSHPKERIRTLCHDYVRYWIDHPEHYRLVFMAEGVTQPEVSMFINQSEITSGFEVFAEALGNAMEQPCTEMMMKVKIDLLLSMMHGIVHNRITMSGYSWSKPEVMIDHMIHNIVLS